MAFLHRLQWIDAKIRRGHYPNTSNVAGQFEISRRQVLRDFDYLRDSLGAPLAYCSKKRGYYYAEDSFVFPGNIITDNQSELLICLASHYEALSQHDLRTSDTFCRIS